MPPIFFAILVIAIAHPAHAQLVAKSQAALQYPPGETIAADVVVQIDVDEAGTVVAAEVRSPASPAFEAAALAFAKAMTFEPPVVDGVAKRIRTDLSLHFEPPAPPPVIPTGPVFESRVRAQRVPTSVSDYHLHVGELADVPRKSAEELLTLAPGILLTNHGGEGHAPQIFLRGFDAGEGQDLEFKLDGVPLNEASNAHSHGYADPHFIIPELVDELRVTEGPFDPRQGDFAVAGSAEYHLGLHERGLRILGGGGSYGQRRLLALWGPRGEADGTFTGVDLRTGDGFGVNRAYGSVSAMAQYEAQASDTTKVTVSAQSYASRFDSAGVIRQDDFNAARLPCANDRDSQFFCTYDPSQSGAVQRHGLSARFVKRAGGETLEQQFFLVRRKLRIVENFTGLLLDTPATGEPQRGDASEKIYDATTAGLRGSVGLRRRANGQRQELELGYFARADFGDTTSRRLRADGGEAYKLDFDTGFDIANVGLYAASVLRPWERLIVRLGLRVDTFAFSILDRNRPLRDRSGTRLPSDARDAFGYAAQPRLSVQYAVGEGLDWVTSVGRGARSSDASALSDGEFAPFSSLTAAETGLALETKDVGARASVFGTKIDNALVFDDVAARNTLQGPSNRFGAVAMARVSHGGWLDAQGSTTWAEAYVPPVDAGFFELAAGTRLPYVPRFVHRLDASARHTFTIAGEEFACSTGLGVTYVAARPLPLGKESDPIFTIDAAARARWNAWELALSLTNLLDARYRLAEFNYASNFRAPDLPPSLRAERTFAAGAPRMGLVTLSYRFGERGQDMADHDVHDDVAPTEPSP